ncbi:MAG: hypothetical protein JO056_05180 [Alphaproteobacteria bacterium]|jgi:hypothetical protein|nr:hypothetical protein [Alphaproteobacteria bacterium]
MGQTLASLPPGKRARLYRQFASDALSIAESAADNGQRANFLGMASGWHALALEAERALDLEETGSDASGTETAGEIANNHF